MNIAILAVDSNYPNLALMKISSYHKQKGDTVQWYNPFEYFDILYMSKVFTFTADYGQVITNVGKIHKGGTGYDAHVSLPEEMEHIEPDYSIYPSIDDKTAYGFLTRGCPNKCKWCVVPAKEGKVKPYQDVESIATNGRNTLILMDNNVLASSHGIEQIKKIIEINDVRKRNKKPLIKVDFNQGLDARLVTEDIAKLLAKLKWTKYIRFGCDTPEQIKQCDKACELIDKAGYKGTYFFYCILMKDFNEAYHRVIHWREKSKNRHQPHCQPYRALDNKAHIIPQWQIDLSRWVDKKWLFRSCEFKDYEPRKGFFCKEYFT